MDISNIIGVIATVAAALVTFYGTYVSIRIIKKDNKPTFLLKGNSSFTQNNSSVNLNIDKKTLNYYDYIPKQEKGKKPKTKKYQIESGLLEFTIETFELIKHLKSIAIGVALVFTVIHITLILMNINFVGTPYIRVILDINNNIIVYPYIFISLFILIYSFILWIVTTWYSHKFFYQLEIRDFIKINSLSLFKQKLINQFYFNKNEEFPIRSINRIIDNIRIHDKNNKAHRYNKRIKYKAKKIILTSRNILLDNMYFRIISLIIILNILYVLFIPVQRNEFYQYMSTSPTPSNKYYISYTLKKEIKEANFRYSGYRNSRNIIRTIKNNEIFYTYVQYNYKWWKIRTQDGQIGYIHSKLIKKH